MKRLAIALLERLVPDSGPLAGDLLEEFARRRSLLWLWWQVLAVAATPLLDRSDEIRPLKLVDLQPADAIERSRRLSLQSMQVNLTPNPLHGVGGVTAAVVLAVLAEVASQLWWVVLASIVAGTALGLLLIARHRGGFSRQRALVFEGLIARSTTALLIVVAISMGVAAQTPASTPHPSRPSFEIASVKPNNTGARSGAIQPGRLAQSGVTIRQLARMAYGTNQLVGGPGWIDSELFDIEGKGSFDMSGFLPGRDGSPPQVYLMLQQLLEDRFKLVVHKAMQERPVYALVAARRDRELGAHLKPSTFDCDAHIAAIVRSGRLSGPSAPGSPPPMPRCAIGGGAGHLMADSIEMSGLASALSQSTDRVVIDRTDLRGRFNVDLQWTPELAGAGPAPNANAAATDAPPALVTAIQEQLGLKLEPTTASIEVLVIDSAARPTPD
jgi:uncharacterized protein (TIGR03435 family)